MTYQQEKKIKDAARAKRARKFRFVPVLIDRTQRSRISLKAGDIVVKIRMHGCPRNGTMGQCYIADSVSGEFIGMVSLNSLVPVVKAADVPSREEWANMNDDARARAGLY